MDDTVRLPSERSFGLLFAAVFAGFAGWAWYAGRTTLAAALLAVSAVFLALALAVPRALALPQPPLVSARRRAERGREPDRAGRDVRGDVRSRRARDAHRRPRSAQAPIRRSRRYLLGRSPSAGATARIVQATVLGTLMSFLKELWAFLKARKKLWLLPIILGPRRARRPADPGAGIGRRALHLHAVLTRDPGG